MKVAILIFACLTVASCFIYPYTVSKDCSSLKCARNSWIVYSTTFSYVCPKSGYAAFIITPTTKELIFDFTAYNMVAKNQKVYIPLIYNPSFNDTGLQYQQTLSDGAQFSILNCTIPNARLVSKLCKSHALVAGKYLNGKFQADCAFGLDYSNDFLPH